MKKKFLFSLIILLFICILGGCTSKSAIEFKNEYESLNGKTNANGKAHRVINIDKNNPFVKITPEELINKIENKESFYVYFGDPLCPWCRSVLEKFIEVINKFKIKNVYYIKIWDEEGNEVLRNKYSLNDKNEIEEVKKGTDSYYKLLKYFNNVLSDYNLTDSNGKSIPVNEKRIYAPNFIHVKSGEAVRLIEGISSLQKDSREELTEDMLNQEEEMFKEFLGE